MILDFEEYNNSENIACFQIDCSLNGRKYVMVGKTEHNKKLIAKCNLLYDTSTHIAEVDFCTVYMLLSCFVPISEHYYFQLKALRDALIQEYFWEVIDE